MVLVNTSKINVRHVFCPREYKRQYMYIKKYPDCERVPPPSMNIINREIKKLRDLIVPYDAPNFEKTTKQEFNQARKELKKMIRYLS